MKFELRSASGKLPPEVGVPVTVHRTYTYKAYPKNPKHVSELSGKDVTREWDETYITVEIDSLEKLMEFINKFGDIVLTNRHPPELETDGQLIIYDDCLE